MIMDTKKINRNEALSTALRALRPGEAVEVARAGAGREGFMPSSVRILCSKLRSDTGTVFSVQARQEDEWITVRRLV